MALIGHEIDRKESDRTGATSGTTRQVSIFVRLILALVLSALSCAVIWHFVPTELNVTTRIVGYATYANFNLNRYVAAYVLSGFIAPLLAVFFYTLLSWTKSTQPKRPFKIELFKNQPSVEGPSHGDSSTQNQNFNFANKFTNLSSPIVENESGNLWSIDSVWALARSLIPAAVVVIEVSSLDHSNSHLSLLGMAAGICYFLSVLLFAYFTASRILNIFPNGGDFRSRLNTIVESLPIANSSLAIVILPLLLLVSYGTSVLVQSTHTLTTYPWLPIPGVVIATGVLFYLSGRVLRNLNIRSDKKAHETKVLTWLVGPISVFLLTARISGQNHEPLIHTIFGHSFNFFWGFDDTHWLVAPQLVLHHGLFPWRDLYFTHGLLQDLYAGQISLSIFGNTWWGGLAGMGMIFIPMVWIMIYCFVAYFAKDNRLMLVAFIIAATTGLLAGEWVIFSIRFLFLPLLFILFDQVLKKSSWFWVTMFISALVISFLLTPEMGIFIPCFLVVLFFFEWSTSESKTALFKRFQRTIHAAAVGVALSAVWFVYLAMNHAVIGFLQFFPDFALSRNLEVAIPPTHWNPISDPLDLFFFLAPLLLWWMTLWRVIFLLRGRRVWAYTDFSMVVGALIAILFWTKALGRLDIVHITESFLVTIPLLFLWLIKITQSVDTWAKQHLSRRKKSPQMRYAATGILVISLLVASTLFPPKIGTYTLSNSIRQAIYYAPQRFHSETPLPAQRALGYTVRGSITTDYVDGLRTLLNEYAGPTAPVFDFSNTPGLYYYLLNRVPGTRFYIAEVAQTPDTQNQLISDLKESRPPVVAFDSAGVGFSNIDYVPDSVRSYMVSHYLFAHYSPLVNYGGQILLLRNDLVAAAPPLPPLPRGSFATEVAFSGPACSLGDIPNFFTPPSNIPSLPKVTATTTLLSTQRGVLSGWAINPTTKYPATRVVAIDSSGHVVASGRTGISRPIVPFVTGIRTALRSGFSMASPTSTTGTVAVYGLSSGGEAFLIAPASLVTQVHTTPPSSTITVDGKTYKTVGATNGNSGIVESAKFGFVKTYKVDIPKGIQYSQYPWIQMNGSGVFGNSSFIVTNVLSPGLGIVNNQILNLGNQMSFNTLPRTGNSVMMNADSCIQWHAYDSSKSLYVVHNGVKAGDTLSVSLIGGPAPS